MLKMNNPYSGEAMDICFTTDSYVNNGRPYVGILCKEAGEDFWEPWSDLTVNLPDEQPSSKTCAFIDVNNNAPGLEEWLKQNNVATPTGMYGMSGWCMYPEYRLNMAVIQQNTQRAD